MITPLLLLGLIASSNHGETPTCSLTSAGYQNEEDSRITAIFRRTRKYGLVFKLMLPAANFSFSVGYPGARAGIDNHFNLVERSDGGSVKTSYNVAKSAPIDALDVLTADATKRFQPGFSYPSSTMAPAMIFIPNLQEVAWYQLSKSQKYKIPMAFFRLSHCQ